jgi:enamine deaminase RidA (YjgF/YER057c/UK114 family)
MRLLTVAVLVAWVATPLVPAGVGKRIVKAKGDASNSPIIAAVVAGDYVYVSGQLGREANGTFGDIRAQTRRALDNISAILQEADTSLEQAVSGYVYLRNKGDFAAMNEAYKAHPGWPKTTHKTARGDDLDLAVRTTMTADIIGPPAALVEITMIALRKGAERTIVQPAEWGTSNLPYPWGIKSGDTLWISGLVASNKRGGPYTRGDMKTDVTQTLTDVGEVLSTAGMSHDDVVFSRVYIQDHSLANEMDEAYRAFFRGDPPARATLRAGIMGNTNSDEITTISVKGAKRIINIPNADVPPSASAAVVVGNRFFSSGIQGVTPATKGDAKAQTREALTRLGAALKAGGFEWGDVVDAWVLLADTRDYADVVEAYRQVFARDFPAATFVGEQPLGRGAVQIQIMAVK